MTLDPKVFPDEDHTFLLTGPVGHLEVATTPGDGLATAIICHPHPLQEGTMNNKVVTTLMRAYKQRGMRTVRFNYRGVGQSQGEYGNMVGEQADLQAIIAWVQRCLPTTELYLAGFSFGAWISAAVAQQVQPQHLISVAPAVNHADFHSLKPLSCPWVVIQGEADEVVPADKVIAWAKGMGQAVKLIQFPAVGHFFHGQLIALRDKVIAAISEEDTRAPGK